MNICIINPNTSKSMTTGICASAAQIANNSTKIIIEKYQNLWADHKRNDLEFIEIFAKDKDGLPQKINIKFKGSVFSLIKI